jgi:hypothetical protein
MRDLITALRKAWLAGSARYYQVREEQRRRHLPDPFLPK